MGSGRNETTEYREILDLGNKNISHILKLINIGFLGKTSITGLKNKQKNFNYSTILNLATDSNHVQLKNNLKDK